jgi:hypothetical protein
MKNKKTIRRLFLITACTALLATGSFAQTDIDALMMAKKNLCIGPMYGHSSWNNYWEGTHKRINENIGTISTDMFSIMGNYGVSGKLNVLFGLPYIKTKASAGTLHGMNGLQDLSLWLKYMPIEKDLGPGVISVYGIGGLSFPVTNYVSDFLPLSIGLHSTNLSLRGMLDYQVGRWFATGSATYIVRSNIKIDRTAYYTTEMHLTNEVKMPNAFSYNIRAGYRSSVLIAEAVLNSFRSLGGFDITINNMPFPSNRMEATTAGINLKYTIQKVPGLSLTGGANYTISGRNMGQSNNYNAGIFYILNFDKKSSANKTSNDSKTN